MGTGRLAAAPLFQANPATVLARAPIFLIAGVGVTLMWADWIYLSFSVPAMIAGLAVTTFRLEPTAYVYGIAVMALAGFTAVAVTHRLTGLSPAPPARPR